MNKVVIYGPCSKWSEEAHTWKTEIPTALLEAQGWTKPTEDSVILSRKEFEQHANEYKNLSIKYDQVFDKYRVCKDVNEKLKQRVIPVRKETAKKILTKCKQLVKKWLSRDDEKVGFLFDFEKFIKKQFDVEIKR